MKKEKNTASEAAEEVVNEASEEVAATDERDERIKALEGELSESHEKYLRMLAEYDNYRKRTQKERGAHSAKALPLP